MLRVGLALAFSAVTAACESPPPAVKIASPAELTVALAGAAKALDPEIIAQALAAYDCASRAGKVGGSVLTIVDYSRPSSERRLWVLDLVAARVVLHEFVAHGSGSGENQATQFSNVAQSKASSIGLFRTLGTYDGKHGLSLKLRGLEPGFNDNAEARSSVIHGAEYVSALVAQKQGRLGRSWGCPAVDVAVSSRLIETIKGGTAIFVYAPDQKWLAESSWLHCKAAGP